MHQREVCPNFSIFFYFEEVMFRFLEGVLHIRIETTISKRSPDGREMLKAYSCIRFFTKIFLNEKSLY